MILDSGEVTRDRVEGHRFEDVFHDSHPVFERHVRYGLKENVESQRLHAFDLFVDARPSLSGFKSDASNDTGRKTPLNETAYSVDFR